MRTLKEASRTLTLGLVLLMVCSVAHSQDASRMRQHQQKPYGTFPPFGEGYNWVISGDGQHFAAAFNSNGEGYCSTDGKTSGKGKRVTMPSITPVGSFVWGEERENGWFVICGQNEFGAYADIGVDDQLITRSSKTGGIEFSRIDVLPYAFCSVGSAIHYKVKKGNRWFLYRNGTPVTDGFDEIEQLSVSPDGNRTAFWGQDEGKHYMVLNGKKAKLACETNMEERWKFSPKFVSNHDLSIIAWVVAGADKSEHLIVNDAQVASGKHVGDPTVAPSGSRWCCSVRCEDGIAVVSDKGSGRKWDEIAQSAIWSANGLHFAYVAQKGGRFYVVRDTESIEANATAIRGGGTAFTPFGNFEIPDCLSVSSDGTWSLVFSGNDKQEYLLVRGKKFGPYQDARPAEFSPDGKRYVAWVAQNKKAWGALVDDVPPSKFEYEGPSEVVWTDDSKGCAYTAKTGKTEYVLSGGARFGPFDGVGNIFFDRSERLLFFARTGDVDSAYCGGIQLGSWSQVLQRLGPESVDGDVLNCIVVQGNHVLKLELDLPSARK